MSAVLTHRVARKRSRASAKAAGRDHEKKVAEYLALHVDDRIERRRQAGSKDRGDIAAVRCRGAKIVIEAKNTASVSVGPHLREAEVERGNDDALVGLVVYKRHGISDPGSQVVMMTLCDLVALITGTRPDAP
jgi:hypothetical protein